jgi:hypothetical protein
MFERPILIYSNYCIHSTNFINELMKNSEMFESFIRINIDVDPNTRSRPSIFYEIQEKLNYKISEIPTIIVDNAEYILTGVNAFEWLEYNLNKKEQEKELTPFNPIEMGSFSDSYSSYGSSDLTAAREQSFKFLNKADDKINTPQEMASNVSKDEYSNKQKERENFDNVYNQQPNQHPNNFRNISYHQQKNANHPPPQQFDPKYLHGSMSEKQKDFDVKLQQMVLDREQFKSVRSPKINPDLIDFKTGNIKTN